MSEESRLNQLKEKIRKWKQEGYEVKELESIIKDVKIQTPQIEIKPSIPSVRKPKYGYILGAIALFVIIAVIAFGIYSVYFEDFNTGEDVWNEESISASESEESLENPFGNISFDSDISELVNGSLDITEDNGITTRVEITLYFKNILDEDINVEYVVEFCDKYDDTLYNQSYEIKNLPAGYIEMSPDIFSYHEGNVADFDHVNIRVLNYEVIE